MKEERSGSCLEEENFSFVLGALVVADAVEELVELKPAQLAIPVLIKLAEERRRLHHQCVEARIDSGRNLAGEDQMIAQ